MYKTIKNIRKIMGNHDSSDLKIGIYSDDSIAFQIYDQEVPIVIDTANKKVYIDCETCRTNLSPDMLKELEQICRTLEENINMIVNLVNRDMDY